MSKFKEEFKNVLLESTFDIEDVEAENKALSDLDSHYIKQLSEALEVEVPDLYKFFDFANRFQYDNKDDIELDKDKMDNDDYIIYIKIFDKFGKPEFDLTDDDLSVIGCNRNDYDTFHSTLK